MGDRAFVSTRKGLFELVDTDGRWEVAAVHFLGEPVTMALQDPRDGALYAALNLGHFGVKLHRRERGADQWTEVAVPVYPPKPGDSTDKLDWSLKMIWSLEPGGADEPGVLWCGTLPGGLFRSRDRGASWDLVRSLWEAPERQDWMGGGYEWPGIHSICVDPRNSRSVLIGVSTGGAWRTEDGGESWALSAKGMRAEYMPPDMQFDENVQDAHRIVRCPGAPDYLWCQHHNGIFRSTDNARSWQEIKAPVSSFGFVVGTHPVDGDTAWFVPLQKDERRVPVAAQMVVNRTRDGGKSFDTLRRGLPQQHCYDVVYRHGLAVHRDGKSLLMASTTGSLWSSRDGGESWDTVSMTLPAASAVCFG